MNGKKLWLRELVGILGAACVALAAINAQIDQNLGHAQQANAAALRKFEWKSRTEVQKDGETKRVQLALMRYDRDGKVQKTIVSSTPEPELPKFGLRKAIAQKKLEEFREKVEQLGALAKSYSELPPSKLQQLMASATVTPELTLQQKLVRIEARNVIQPGDSMTLWVDALSRKQRRIEIQTTMDRKPVRIISEFQDIQRGPTYMARSQVSYDGNAVVIVTENFDYAPARS